MKKINCISFVCEFLEREHLLYRFEFGHIACAIIVLDEGEDATLGPYGTIGETFEGHFVVVWDLFADIAVSLDNECIT